MATAAMEVPPPAAQRSHEWVNVPIAEIPSSAPADSADARAGATGVLDALNRALSQRDYAAVSQLFIKGGFWRDHLCLSWEFRAAQGRDKILDFLQSCARSRDGFRLKKLSLDTSIAPSRQPQLAPFDVEGKSRGIQAIFLVDTTIGSGQGVMRLVMDGGQWRIFTLYTTLCELKGHGENTFHRRPRGVDSTVTPDRDDWATIRKRQTDFEDGTEPAVIVVGAGQAGLSIAARLKSLGVRVLIIDRNERVGDSWRKRYRHLVLHDVVWYDHMPYLSFPPQWPVFAPKDKLANFLESYADILELDVWTQAELQKSEWDDKTGAWTVVISRKTKDGSSQTRTFHPRHIIQATGHSGLKKHPAFAGADGFKGDRLCHSSEFPGAPEKGGSGKKAVVIGSCNSAHDIAQDYLENGYEVTMVQRSGTYVVSTSSILDIAFKGLYDQDGPPVEDADLLAESLPGSVLKAVHAQVTALQRENDKETLSGLAKAGFKAHSGPDGAGIFFQYLQYGGGYYIDVGGCRLIADGKIKVKQGQEVEQILPHGVRLADGSELPADEIVLATGYQTMESQTRHLFGDKVADRVHGVFGFNDEGEIRTVWQQSGHPGFWYHGGNLAFCRFYSRLLALQIKGLEEGLYGYGEI
ncbi:hypothetical protein CDD83_613 [Cordyceps sp. RAO-2017]|nr:hypothetical protein CDD83_613 [Cordyceps sp. RAO-2017]